MVAGRHQNIWFQRQKNGCGIRCPEAENNGRTFWTCLDEAEDAEGSASVRTCRRSGRGQASCRAWKQMPWKRMAEGSRRIWNGAGAERRQGSGCTASYCRSMEAASRRRLLAGWQCAEDRHSDSVLRRRTVGIWHHSCYRSRCAYRKGRCRPDRRRQGKGSHSENIFLFSA